MAAAALVVVLSPFGYAASAADQHHKGHRDQRKHRPHGDPTNRPDNDP